VLLVPVILSGGTGSRLWPVSRASHPKPFMQLPSGQSLLQKTFLRACHFSSITEVLTITNESHYLKHKAEYEKTQIEKPPLHFLLEPEGRNTAPAIALAALRIAALHGPDAMMLVLPADHLISDTDLFAKQAEMAFTLAQQNKLVTFGITPTTAETGFGYIECGAPISSIAYQVLRFIEKPTADIAETFIASKRFLWNAGMFCFKAGVVLQELARHAPLLLDAAKMCWQASSSQQKDSDAIRLEKKSFAVLPDISIDYALMEKSSAIAVLACQFDWQDVGSWEAYKKLHQTDEDGNAIVGDAILIDSQNNFIQSDHRMVAAIGIHDLAVIDTADALLITHRERTQDVKQLVQTLKNQSHDSYLHHRTVIRPWGSYTVLEEGPTFKIKRIVVHPHHSLSLQLHHHRSEHWIVVEGMAEVVNGDKTYQLNTNESTFVPKETKHRLSNPYDKDLVIIEVQAGSYVGEDDIVRLEDVYGRVF
jgi:mannose-1-phosphate guanylyltransferase/mannose-6-phosphate isomerase